MCHFVLVFFSPFSIVITSLGEERANLSAFRTFVRFVLVWICRFPLQKNKMTHGKTYNKSPRRVNHKATKSKTNTGRKNYAVFAFSYICLVRYFVWYDLNISLKLGYCWKCLNLWLKLIP